MKMLPPLNFVSRQLKQVIPPLVMALLTPTLGHAQTVLPSDAKPSCAVSTTTFNSWFANGSASLNGVVKPANSLTFQPSSDCAFFLWSEQMFLWLTSPTPASYGGGSGNIFDSPTFFGVTPATNGKRFYVPNKASSGPIPILPIMAVRAAQLGPNGLQLITDTKGRMFEVLPAPLAESGNSLIRNAKGQMLEVSKVEADANGKVKFQGVDGKTIEIGKAFKINSAMATQRASRLTNLTASNSKNLVQGIRTGNGQAVFIDSSGNQITPSQGQAGDGGVLMAQNGSLVYYATMVNDVFAYFQSGTANGSITPPATQFPISTQTLQPTINYAQTQGVTFPDPEALAIEVKSAWINAANLDTTKFITAKASVPVYTPTQNNTVWVPSGSQEVTLALVGMHVVGSATNHPEMIWSTFEHITNSPNGNYAYTNTSGQTVQVPQSSGGSWLFSGSGGNYNYERMSFQSPNIIGTAISGGGTNTIGPINALRWKAWGSPANGSSNTTSLNTQVISINNSVLGQLANGDIRANYIFTGSTWTNGGFAPNNPTNGSATNQIGTNMLANTTMETFQQGNSSTGTSPSTNGSNCFSCHTSPISNPNSTNTPVTTAVSHIYSSLTPLPKK